MELLIILGLLLSFGAGFACGATWRHTPAGLPHDWRQLAAERWQQIEDEAAMHERARPLIMAAIDAGHDADTNRRKITLHIGPDHPGLDYVKLLARGSADLRLFGIPVEVHRTLRDKHEFRQGDALTAS